MRKHTFSAQCLSSVMVPLKHNLSLPFILFAPGLLRPNENLIKAWVREDTVHFNSNRAYK